jgi:adenine-specific DNA-methyltransferase
MDGKSFTPVQEKIDALRQVLPEVFSEGKVDWEKLKATLGENINFSNERYVLNWAGKSDAFKVLQMPTAKTLLPAKEESINFDETENIFIEGDNLEVLKVLQKSYFNKVKMIYIDPPYNTGSDSFIYPDKFSESKTDYQKRVGDKDEEGYMIKDGMFKRNSKENGQYHSNWLNMMMPRLYLAKNLLRQDGVIFVSIDDNEVHNLRLLMNEIFGEENFINTITWEKRYSPQNAVQWFSESHDFILVYAKIKDTWAPNLLERSEEMNARYRNLDNDHRGEWKATDATAQGGHGTASQFYELTAPNGKTFHPPTGRCWVYTEERMQEMIRDNRVWFGSSGDSAPAIKRFLNEVKQGVACQTIWKYEEVGHNQEGKKEIKVLFPEAVPFDTPKPTRLIKRILQLCTSQSANEIVLDFFAGSSTTADAVMQLNVEDGGRRNTISVQLPDICDEKSDAFKMGYETIAEISKERIRRAGKKIGEEIQAKIKTIESEIKKLQGEIPTEETIEKISGLKSKISNLQYQDLGFKVLKLEDSNFKQWQQIEGKDSKALAEQMKLFVDPVSENATIENMVFELLLKSGKDLNSTIEKNDNFYKINGNELILLLEKATQEIVDAVINEKPIKVIALDKLFTGNDQLKTNTVLQMKDAGIEFKTI